MPVRDSTATRPDPALLIPSRLSLKSRQKIVNPFSKTFNRTHLRYIFLSVKLHPWKWKWWLFSPINFGKSIHSTRRSKSSKWLPYMNTPFFEACPCRSRYRNKPDSLEFTSPWLTASNLTSSLLSVWVSLQPHWRQKLCPKQRVGRLNGGPNVESARIAFDSLHFVHHDSLLWSPDSPSFSVMLDSMFTLSDSAVGCIRQTSHLGMVSSLSSPKW